MLENQLKMDVDSLRLTLQKFGILDCILFGVILLLSVMIGVYFIFYKNKKVNNNNNNKNRIENQQMNPKNNNNKNIEELQYLVGSRNMSEFPVAMSLIASFVSGVSIIGLSTEIYMYGILYFYTIPTIILGGFLCWYIFLPIFCDLKLTSIYEYFEMRFDKRIRLFGSLINFIGILFWMPMVIYVPGLVMNQFTGINIYLIAAIISIICVFYTCMGGIKTVIWTDFFQGFIILGSTILIMIKGIIELGGFKEIFNINYYGGRIELPEITTDPNVRYSLMAIIIGGTISWTESTCCGQVMMQRFLSVSSVAKARKVLIYYMVGISLLLCICIFNGLILYAYYHNCDPLTTKLAEIKDQLLPLFIMEIFYQIPGMNGIFIGGIVSAALSTLSTGLNSLAAIFLEDFLKTNYSKPLSNRQTTFILKFVVVFFGVISFILIFFIQHLGIIFQLSRTLGAICGGPLFGLFLIGVLMPWINATSALAGCSLSFISMSWICIKAQILYANSNYIQKSLSVSDCDYIFTLQINNTMLTDNTRDVDDSHIQNISYLWYSPLGAFITILIANCTTLLFGYVHRNEWNKKLIASCLRKYATEEIKEEKILLS